MYSIEEFDKEKTKVLKYILYKKRTKKEVLQKFSSVIDQELLEDIIENLEENGYIDDHQYIERAVNEFVALKNMSMKEIKYKLLAKGLSSDIIEEYFLAHDEELEEFEKQSIKNIYYKKQNMMEENEIIQLLLKKGYHMDYIKQVLSEVK